MAQIKVFAGRLKKVQFTWRSGASPSSPTLDLSLATCELRSSSLGNGLDVSIIDAVNGLCEITFPETATAGKKGPHWLVIALTYLSNPGYSPDPVRVEVSVV